MMAKRVFSSRRIRFGIAALATILACGTITMVIPEMRRAASLALTASPTPPPLEYAAVSLSAGVSAPRTRGASRPEPVGGGTLAPDFLRPNLAERIEASNVRHGAEPLYAAAFAPRRIGSAGGAGATLRLPSGTGGGGGSGASTPADTGTTPAGPGDTPGVTPPVTGPGDAPVVTPPATGPGDSPVIVPPGDTPTVNPPGAPGDPVVPTPAAAAPEPATWLMMILGFGLIGASLRRRAVHRSRAVVLD